MKRVALALAAVLAACGSGDAVTDGPARYLALGDSYTIGESVAEEERWPNLLAERLEGSDHGSIEVEIIATTGWTTAELDAGIDAADPQGPYDLVSLLIGVNNQFRGLDIDAYRMEFAGLLDRAIGFAGGDPGRVFVVSIPDWGVTPFAVSAGRSSEIVGEQIDAFNAVNRDETEQRGVAWVDVTAISRSGEPDLIAQDGLHPSGEQYRRWVDAIYPVVAAMLDR